MTPNPTPVPLSVVMPAYNEEAGIADVLDEVCRLVLDVVPGSELVVVDDCSTDATSAVLAAVAERDGRIRVVRNETNRGHGPSLRRAIDISRGEWVLHLDSDGQVDVTEFPRLWELRAGNDLVLGVRADRHDPALRLALTKVVRGLVSVLARQRVRDANTPFKLISRRLFDHLSPSIPPDSFAPSILLVLGAHRSGASVRELDVTHLSRPHGTSSLHLRRLLSAVARSTRQTVRFARTRLEPFDARVVDAPGSSQNGTPS